MMVHVPFAIVYMHMAHSLKLNAPSCVLPCVLSV